MKKCTKTKESVALWQEKEQTPCRKVGVKKGEDDGSVWDRFWGLAWLPRSLL